MTSVSGLAFALVLLSSIPPEPAWPDGIGGKFHLLGAAALGSCVRWNTPAAGTGVCGELGLAGEVAVSPRWNLTVELGIGFMNRTTSSDFGGARSTGGPAFAALRVMAGHDVFRFFFVRPGLQVRTNWALGRANAGAQLAVDVGTRVGDRLELGMRPFAGFDGVASTGSPGWSPALSFGATFLARVRFR